MSILSILVNGIAVLMVTVPVAVALFSQQAASATAGSVDPQIAAAVHDVSAAHIQQTIEKLVSFETRQTLS